MRRIVLFGILACVAYATSANATPEPPGSEVTTTVTPTQIPMRISAIHKADKSYIQALSRMARAIEEGSGKQIRPELLTNGKKGSEEETLQEQIHGTLEAGFTSAFTLSHQVSAFRVLGIPLLFNKPEHVRDWMGSPLDLALREAAKAKKLKILGYASYGFYGVLSWRAGEKAPIPDSASDPPSLDNLQVRIPRDAWMTVVHQTLGLKPFALPTMDLAGAVSAGWIKGVVATPELLQGTDFPMTGGAYFNMRHLHGWSIFSVNLDWFEKLPPDLQTVIENGVTSVLPKTLEQSMAQEAKLLKEWSSDGHLQILTPSPGETASKVRKMALKTASEMETLLNQPGAVTQLWEQNLQSASVTKPKPEGGATTQAPQGKQKKGSGDKPNGTKKTGISSSKSDGAKP
ncbi:MAG: TRAP transporter substrate-binding protein DctP [Magnetococcus sp. YQC-5]